MMIFSSFPKELKDHILKKAYKKKVVFPEGEDKRCLEAANILKNECHVEVISMSPDLVRNNYNLTLTHLKTTLLERGKASQEAIELLAHDPFYSSGVMLHNGQADGVVGGANTSTAHVIKSALATIGLKDSSHVITSAFLMELKTPTPGGEPYLIFGDCAVLPDPSDKQLAHIAALCSQAKKAWLGGEPRVAFLSFSTQGSATHKSLEKIIEATHLFQQLYPHILAEGEVQVDAAIVPEVALRKNENSQLKGQANVLVFPDLNSGNISYKLAQRLGQAQAFGPILLGTRKPFSDLSRGASALDIVHTTLLCLALDA